MDLKQIKDANTVCKTETVYSNLQYNYTSPQGQSISCMLYPKLRLPIKAKRCR